MGPQSYAIVPVFLWRPKASRPIQVGSSVLLRIAGRNCLLTAAHVTDLRAEGKLCIPGLRGATEFAGGIGFNPLRPGMRRDDDPLDVAFLLPMEDKHSQLPENFRPVHPAQIDVSGRVLPGEFCLVAGFPSSRAWVKLRAGAITSSSLNFVGIAASHSRYEEFGHDPKVNILIEYHIDKAIYPEGDTANPPLPRGMSGGAVFRLEADQQNRPISSSGKLVGIMHKFKGGNMFVATQLAEVLKLVAQRLPDDARRHMNT